MIETRKKVEPTPLARVCEQTASALTLCASRSPSLRADTVALVDAVEKPLTDIETALSDIRRATERASLREEDPALQRNLGTLEGRYNRANDLARQIRRNSLELARLLQRIEKDRAKVTANAVERGLVVPEHKT